MAALAVSTAIASGCSTVSERPVVRLEFQRPLLPAVAATPCAAPVQIPDRAITAGETTGLWGRDRVSLRECERRRAAAVDAVEAGKARTR